MSIPPDAKHPSVHWSSMKRSGRATHSPDLQQKRASYEVKVASSGPAVEK